ncbi:hypothetical protein CMQ_6859 [Grosmannia clavigera kw1407]|uniref:Uncharacterized protein n=1 Tax=Grosmannia clavigera (strain kw1407 / UAMH 11150) TaxID=655863 RepID=F0X6P9_GROCL|nr:uncharacterized protein CMQ_6859 [Grosmannia clavigera kw1407]EFX06538.1 hypothetical protein CMQ_6859 [Grosmannia clavigera kw1407]
MRLLAHGTDITIDEIGELERRLPYLRTDEIAAAALADDLRRRILGGSVGSATAATENSVISDSLVLKAGTKLWNLVLSLGRYVAGNASPAYKRLLLHGRAFAFLAVHSAGWKIHTKPNAGPPLKRVLWLLEMCSHAASGSILASIGLCTPHGRKRAQELVEDIEAQLGPNCLCVNIVSLELIAASTSEDFDAPRYSKVLLNMIENFDGSSKEFRHLRHYIQQLHNKSPGLGCEDQSWPEDDIQYLAIKAFNEGISWFAQRQEGRVRQWTLLADRLSDRCRDGGRLKETIRRNFSLLNIGDLELRPSIEEDEDATKET